MGHGYTITRLCQHVVMSVPVPWGHLVREGMLGREGHGWRRLVLLWISGSGDLRGMHK